MRIKWGSGNKRYGFCFDEEEQPRTSIHMQSWSFCFLSTMFPSSSSTPSTQSESKRPVELEPLPLLFYHYHLPFFPSTSSRDSCFIFVVPKSMLLKTQRKKSILHPKKNRHFCFCWYWIENERPDVADGKEENRWGRIRENKKNTMKRGSHSPRLPRLPRLQYDEWKEEKDNSMQDSMEEERKKHLNKKERKQSLVLVSVLSST